MRTNRCFGREFGPGGAQRRSVARTFGVRSEEHTSELQSLAYLVCRLLLEKKNVSLYRYDIPRSGFSEPAYPTADVSASTCVRCILFRAIVPGRAGPPAGGARAHVLGRSQ